VTEPNETPEPDQNPAPAHLSHGAEAFNEAPERAPRVTASGIESGGDVIIAGNNAQVVRQYISTLAKLPSRTIHHSEILLDDFFAPVGEPMAAVGGVRVLAGPPETGRRTAALRLLAGLPEVVELRRLLPDWDEPDVDRIPLQPRTGYLLDLTGTMETVSEELRGDLADYAARAEQHGSLLVILGDEQAWGTRKVPWAHHRIAARDHRRPDAVEVARLRLQNSQHPERADWIDSEDSSFHGLLVPDAPPARGVELADIVLDADGPRDETAKDRFLGWRNHIRQWFAGDVRQVDGKEAEKRTLRIAAAFLDGSPAEAVLNSAELLVPEATRERFEEWGGALAGPDDETRCLDAGVGLREGRVYVTDNRPGLDTALIHYLWANRGSLAKQMTAWLAEISAPDGPAEGCLERLSDVLTRVAVAQGKDAVLPLVHAWLDQGTQKRTGFAVKVLDHLAVHPVLGSPVRADLGNWAKGTGRPERQRAVVEVSKREFGKAYPEQALTRLRYVLEKTEDLGLRGEAVGAVARLLDREGGRLAVLKVLVDWVEDERTAALAGRLFLDLFHGGEGMGEDADTDPARGLLHIEGEEGDAARELLRRAWSAVWEDRELCEAASRALHRWEEATADGTLPVDRTYAVVTSVCNARHISTELDRLIRADNPVGARLRDEFWERSFDTRRDGDHERVPA
jgi:hypothetical protein